MPKKQILDDPRRPKLPPAEFAGQWVAWNKDRSHVIAHGADLVAVHDAAIALGEPDALFEKINRPDRIFIGCQ